jgi:ribonuclease P protein subunit RPR2
LNSTTRRIALQRISRLFELAKGMISKDEALGQRYVAIARKLSMASRTSIPLEYKRQICKRCKRFILPGVNCRVRVQQRREPHVVITCGYCGQWMRYPTKARRKRKNVDQGNTFNEKQVKFDETSSSNRKTRSYCRSNRRY